MAATKKSAAAENKEQTPEPPEVKDDASTQDGSGNQPPKPNDRKVTKGMVKVRALRHLGEGGEHYHPAIGKEPASEFECTPERAKALGRAVEVIEEGETDEE